MALLHVLRLSAPRPSPAVVLEFLKPVTWFPPMWAFACGVVSSGEPVLAHAFSIVLGVLLAGPLVCACSQAVNDWYDRDVDAINQPERPIPSGRLPGRWGFGLAVAWTLMSALVAVALGPTVLAAAVVGLLLAWAYSAPPLRFKRNGWIGNAVVGLCYEGLPWVTGASVMLGGGVPGWPVWAAAGLYSLGAHGIMTLNDFKSITGDRVSGVASLPVQLGAAGAAWWAGMAMLVPQAAVVAMLAAMGAPGAALLVAGSMLVQIVLFTRFVAAPVARATWFSAWGVLCYVSGMMVTAVAIARL